MKEKKIKSYQKIIAVVLVVVLVAGIIIGTAVFVNRKQYFCQYAKPFYYSQISSERKPELIAHRGAAVYAPENTLPAYEIAAELGFHYAETDIRSTADGVWVLSHDENLKRMTGFNGKVESMTLEQVRSHRITKGGCIEMFLDLKTPTLEDFLNLCVQNKLNPVIEIKTFPAQMPDAPYQDILLLLEQYRLMDKAIIISFDYTALQTLREYNRQVQMQYLVKKLDDACITKVQQLGNCGIDCEYKALLKAAEMAEIARKSNIPLNAWTVDKKADVQKIADFGVDFITTNAAVPHERLKIE